MTDKSTKVRCMFLGRIGGGLATVWTAATFDDHRPFIKHTKQPQCGMETCTYYAGNSACSGRLDANDPTCFGAPNDIPCERPNTCFSNYHTCTDISIDGIGNVDDFEIDQQPEEWPYRKLPASQYGLEAADWEGGWLKGVPSNFTTVADFLQC